MEFYMAKNKSKTGKKPLPVKSKTPEPVEKASSVSITEEQKSEIQEMQTNLNSMDKEIALLSRREALLQLHRVKLTQQMLDLESAMRNKVGVYAAEKGIDVDDPSKGKWDFNIAEGVFTKKES